MAGEKPNILFIAIDDLKPSIGAYTKAVPTPAMDRIAARGTTFLNAHCQQAVCGPSRASVMTGKYPDFTQIWDLKTKIRAIHPEIVTLTQHFKNNGYHTAGVGKIFDPRSVDKGADSRSWSEAYTQTWHLEYNENTGKPIGHYHNSKSKTLAAEDNSASWNIVNKKLFANNAWPAVEALDVPDDAYDDGAIAAHAVKSLAKLAKKKKPFFLAVGFKKPHLPFVAPKQYWDQFDPKSIQISVLPRSTNRCAHLRQP
ncbi:MAG: sulfatase-like hydrolase/transferase [Coraliomargaritaceae bacterium]